MLDNNKLKIAMLELSDQNRAVLDYYFSSTGSSLYSVVSEDKADAFITDYDFPGAKSHVAKIQETSNKPIIILSVREKDIPFTIWLSKPLSADALTKAATSLKQMIADSADNIDHIDNTEGTELSESIEREIETVDTTENEILLAELSENVEVVAKEPEFSIETSTSNIDAKQNNEIRSDLSTASPALAGDFDLDVLNEENFNSDNLDLTNEDTKDSDLDVSDLEDKSEEQDVLTFNDNNSKESLVEESIENKDEDEDLELDIDVHKKIEAQLAIAGTAGLAAVALGAVNTSDTDVNDDIETIEEPDTEVDALLDSLMSETEEDLASEFIDTEASDTDVDNDIFEDSLALDNDIDNNNDISINSDTSETISNELEIDQDSFQLETTPQENTDSDDLDAFNFLDDNSLNLDESSVENSAQDNVSLETNTLDIDTDLESLSLNDTQVEESKTESSQADEINLDDLSLLDEGLPSLEVEEDALVTEEKNENLLEESFTIQSDNRSTDVESFTETLDVDYSNIKTDESSEIVKTYDSMDSEDSILKPELEEQASETENLDINTEESPEKSGFNFDFEKNESLLAENELIINSLESSEDEVFTNLNSSPQNNADAELDSLLAEVSGIDEDIIEPQEEKIEAAPIKEAVPSIKSQTANLSSNLNETAELSGDGADDDLQSLLNEVRQEADSLNTNNAKRFSEDKSNYNHTKAEKRWMQLSGNNEAITAQKEVAKISYKLENHLLSTLLDQLKKVKGSEQLYRLKYNDLIIVIDDSHDSIYCNFPVTTREFSEICFKEVEHMNIKIHDLDYSEVRLYRHKIKENPERAHTIESFIWVTSLLTSRGRLPEKTEVTKKVGLKVWPNLTRCEIPPHAMNIAAVLSKNPGSLLQIPEWLNIEQKYVFAFYNAAFILDMIESDSSKLKKASLSFNKKNSNDKSEQRGFFGRLLKRLKT